MTDRRIITVFGATGLQGGSVAARFLDDPELKDAWTVRAVTRDSSKPSAKALSEQGAQVVLANLDDKPSLVEAVRGSDAVFGVTNYWERANPDDEIQQGKNLADAVKETGVAHYIWSSLLNVTELSNGKLPNVLHFDSKAKVEQYTRSLGVPATFFLPGFYMSNFGGGRPMDLLKPSPPDNAWTLAVPIAATASIPVFHPSDTGIFVKAIVLHCDELLGKRVLGATAYLTVQEVLDTFKRVYPEDAGGTARYVHIPEEAFRGFMAAQGMPEHAITETYENARLLEDYGYFGGASLDETHALLGPGDRLTTWEEYARDHAPAFKELN